MHHLHLLVLVFLFVLPQNGYSSYHQLVNHPQTGGPEQLLVDIIIVNVSCFGLVVF